MPSKLEKQQKKTPSRSPQSANSSVNPGVNGKVEDDYVKALLKEASTRYSCMVGGSSFIGRMIDVDTNTRGAKLWLSESSMVASSLFPSSTVSISIAATFGNANGYPLCSLSDDCKSLFDNERVAEETEVGSYFALATIFPSSKLSRNEARVSSDLYYTLGCPELGKFIFVHCIGDKVSVKEGIGICSWRESSFDSIHFYESKELDLEFFNFKTGGISLRNCKERADSPLPASKQKCQNGISSPMTPPQVKASSVYGGLNSWDCEDSPIRSDVKRNIEEALRECRSKKILQSCATSWLQSRALLQGNLVNIPFFSKTCFFRVRISAVCGDEDFKQNGRKMSSVDRYAVLVTPTTKVNLRLPSDSTDTTESNGGLPFRDTELQQSIIKLGGLKKEYDTLMKIITFSKENSLSSLGFRAPKGVLLHGPPGTGKTSLARQCVRDAGVSLFTMDGSEIMSLYDGESEQAMEKIFISASQGAPAVIFIDDMDIFTSSKGSGGEMVRCLVNLVDGMDRNNGVLVIAATNRLEGIDPALRSGGRLDIEIEIGVPSPDQRYEILQAILNDMDLLVLDEHIQQIAKSAHGFVGADLSALCNEAAIFCYRRYKFSMLKRKGKDIVDELHSLVDDQSVINGSDDESMERESGLLKVTLDDFEAAKLSVKPSAMKDVILKVPKVTWEDVGGHSEVKMQLVEAVVWPHKYPDAFIRSGVKPPGAVLMFGPPGCSKTLLARAVASEAGLNFLAVKGPELFSKWVGESEKAVRSLFAKARANSPSIIFFDEIDALAATRGSSSDNLSVSDRVISQLLVEFDGLHERGGVTVIGATNRPDKIDGALLRPGRFDRILFVGPPNEAEREEIFRIHLRRIPCGGDVSAEELAGLSDGCSGAVIASICSTAAVAALEEDVDASVVTMRHFRSAIGKVRPYPIEDYASLSAKFQRFVISNRHSSLNLLP